MNTNRIITGDSLEALEDLEDNSVHAIVTDPPYGLAFMGRDWDDFEPKEYQEWCEEWATKAKTILKPGGHLLAFSGNRTHHRLFSGVEDAGFEIRDTITYHFGSGFPKALDVSKSIDKQADAEREVVGPSTLPDGTEHEYNVGYGEGEGYESKESDRKETTPATDAAKKWDGWKTALKPATEFVVLARNPLSEDTVAENIQTHGTGALNIDGCRVEGDVDTTRPDGPNNPEIYGPQTNDNRGSETGGRYPSNVVFDEQAANELDQEVGELSTGDLDVQYEDEGTHIYGEWGERHTEYSGDTGGPSRYFYTSKASKAERTEDGKIENSHPTVKPIDLMEWLVKLVTKENQIVLDPFCGSGTTCKAAKKLNREFIGIEKQAKWADVSRVRCNLTPNDPIVVRDDENQNGLEEYTN